MQGITAVIGVGYRVVFQVCGFCWGVSWIRRCIRNRNAREASIEPWPFTIIRTAEGCIQDPEETRPWGTRPFRILLPLLQRAFLFQPSLPPQPLGTRLCKACSRISLMVLLNIPWKAYPRSTGLSELSRCISSCSRNGFKIVKSVIQSTYPPFDGDKSLPKRLIDVGDSLRPSKDDKGRCTALSHSGGNVGTFPTTKENLEARCSQGMKF